ncbi:hypothetical protein WJX74_005908 [Apatococcus lobatus]|uniref:Elongation factor 1-gamma n=2 Tax=Apatococcus TaxID=904362 RepID=A0AAW1SNW3_9CHLO
MVYTVSAEAGSRDAAKAQITAKFAKVDVKVGTADKALSTAPFKKSPLLQTPEGHIVGGNTIARFLAQAGSVKGLTGTSAYHTALIEEWIELLTSDLQAPLDSWYLPLVGVWSYDKKKEDAAQKAVASIMDVLEAYLLHESFLAGHKVTLADIIAVCILQPAYAQLFDEAFRKQYTCVTRWYLTCVSQAPFQAVFKDASLCKTPITVKDAPKGGAPAAPGTPAQAAPGNAKEQKPKAEKAAAKPKEAPAPKAAEEDEPKPAPKPKSPLDLLPPSTMILDSWKRLYSNSPSSNFRETCIAGLWKGGDIPNSPNKEHFAGFDPEGFSIWWCDYKYDDENTINYQVMNKVGGFLQRIDYVRKYAFGVMCILKDDKGQFPIRGAWIFRGQEIPKIMLDECYDMELYDWRKADLSDEAQKARLEDMISEEAKIDGLEHVECKVFK